MKTKKLKILALAGLSIFLLALAVTMMVCVPWSILPAIGVFICVVAVLSCLLLGGFCVWVILEETW